MIFKVINTACNVEDKLDNKYVNILTDEPNKKRFNVKSYEWEHIPVDDNRGLHLVENRAVIYVSIDTIEDFILLRDVLGCEIITYSLKGEEYLEIYDDYRD